MLTSAIDAKEKNVTCIGIPNAFIQTEMGGDKVIMKLRGELAELLVTICPQLYRQYLMDENGKMVLYVELLKALYGTLKAALFFYLKLKAKLESIGFKLNPYDVCVANKMINGKQFTVVWHVDDLKLSHVDKNVVSKMIEWFKEVFEDKEIGLVKVSRGKEHKFLGMNFKFNDDKVSIEMKSYVQDMIDTCPEKITSKAVTPAAAHLFKVREDCGKLDDKKASVFHTVTAKGLFLSKRARPDILTTIAFLSTRVKEPDEDDWKKMIRLLNYLNGTKNLIMSFSVDNLNILKWYVDVSHQVHPDYRSHTGGVLTFGKGSLYNKSSKQKINTRSSTESELVGVDDMIVQIL